MVRSVQGRTLVYAIVYSLGATRCIILHLATSESLQHAMGGEDGSLMLCGLTVALVSLALVQVTCSAFSGASPGVTPSLQQLEHGESLRHAMGRQNSSLVPRASLLHFTAWRWARRHTASFYVLSFSVIVP